MKITTRGGNEIVFALKDEVLKKHKQIMFDLDFALVEETPRKTGRAKGNWIASINTAYKGVTTKLWKTNNTPAISSIKQPCISYLSNNLPYIQRLNEGWSKQAEAGYIEDIINRVVKSQK